MDRLILVSADSHACGPAEEYLEYMDKATRREAYGPLIEDERRTVGHFKSSLGMLRPDQVDEIDDRDAVRSGRARGTYDVKCRLEEMDAEGIAGELIFPAAYMGTVPFFEQLSLAHPPALRTAGAKAYNRWLADRLLSAGNGRLYGVACPGSYHDMGDAIQEMEWAAEHGFVAVSCPGSVKDLDLPPLYDPYWRTFWAACVDLELVVTIHAGFHFAQGQIFDMSASVMRRIEESSPGELLEPGNPAVDRSGFFFENVNELFDKAVYAPRRALWEIMLSGAFDAHPDLRVVPTEVRVDWVPGLLAFLDSKHESGDFNTPHSPSYYWGHNCYGCASPLRPPDVTLRKEVGVSRFLFGRDYPHAEGMWPNTAEWLRATLRDVAPEESRQILGLNAIECYRLDAGYLRRIAARIGPTIDELQGGVDVDQRYIDNFDRRAGYNKPIATLDLDDIEMQLRQDVAAAAGQVRTD